MLCASTTAAHPTAPSPADIARRNGALSQGPITEAGKARSARNATRHGICASSAAPVDPEDAAALAALRAAMLARHQPLDEAEAHWVEELVFVAWRQRRLRVLEDAVLAQTGTETVPALPSLATLIRYRGRLDRDWRRATEELAILRRGRKGMVDPSQLRWLADRLDHAQTAPERDAPKSHERIIAHVHERTGLTPRSPYLRRRTSRPRRARTNPDTPSRLCRKRPSTRRHDPSIPATATNAAASPLCSAGPPERPQAGTAPRQPAQPR